MTRSKKLVTVALLLAVGIALAWPFRKTGEPNSQSPAATSPAPVARTALPDESRDSTGPAAVASRPHVVAKMASTTERPAEQDASEKSGSFDLANHPALSNPLAAAAKQPVTPAVPPVLQRDVPVQNPAPTSRPAYATAADSSRSYEELPDEVLHVVENGDTLEKLADRYLDDASRALEIFDLNRDRLTNPHLLPIEAKLRIPVDPRRMVD